MPPEPPPQATSATGQPSWMASVMPVVPDHELLRRIGGGSYGDVWLARTTVGTWRAVKVVFRDRFTDARPYEREFNGIQKFEPLSRGNEAFIDILQIGRNDAEGYFYYVMELADDAGSGEEKRGKGEKEITSEGPAKDDNRSSAPFLLCSPATYVPKTLSKVLLQRGRLPVNECLELGLTLNLGLAHLHRAGLIHRDIKPSNLIFVGGVPKLADIGLVIETAEARSYVGTEGFIPPEGPNSPQADLYSLGKVLYEAGMGKDRKDFPEPFTQLAESPDATELLEFNAILLKACASNVKERYQSAEEMNADLALLQSGGSVRRQRKLAGQLRFVQRAGSIITVLAALIGLGWWWQARQTHLVRGLVVEKTKLADANSRLADDNRERIVRLDVANGVSHMDRDDLSGALLWFADALSLVTNKPTEEAIHRIRIQQLLDQMPRLLEIASEGGSVQAGGFSPDGNRAVTGTIKGGLRVWELESGRTILQQPDVGGQIAQIRFSRDGRRLLLSSASLQGNVRNPPSMRPGFAAVLDAQTGQEIFPAAQLIPGMSSNLFYSAFSPDDRWLAVALSNQIIRVLDARDGQLVAELRGHTDEIRMFTFSTDGTLLASASKDKTARLWRLPSGEPVGQPIQHDGPLRRVAFNPNGSRLATATESPSPGDPASRDTNCVVQTWDVQTGRRTGPPIQETKMLFMLTFDEHTGKTLITGDAGPRARVWDAETHSEKLASLKMRSDASCWAFSPDGRAIAVGSYDGAARIWDLGPGEMRFTPFRTTGWIESVHFSPDGSRLLITSADGTARIHDLGVADKSLKLHFEADVRESQNESWHRTPGPLVVPLKDGSFRLVDIESLKEIRRLTPSQTNGHPYECLVGPLGRSWAAYRGPDELAGDQLVDIWREQSNGLQHLTVLRGRAVPIFNPDETQFLTCQTDRKIRSWRTSNGGLAETFSLPEGRTEVFAFLPDAKRALVLGADGDLELMEIASQRTLSTLQKQPFKCSRFAIDPQGTWLAGIGGEFGFVINLATGKLTSTPFKYGGHLSTLDFSPDGRRLLTGGPVEWVNLWDTSTGKLFAQPMTMNRMIRFACWSADGRFIATRSDENGARVWDASTAEPVTPLLVNNDFVLRSGITRNHRLVTVSKPNLLRAWDLKQTQLPLDVIADYAKLISARQLSASGARLPLKADEMVELYHSLRARAPQLFK